jgi:hypothetical protein
MPKSRFIDLAPVQHVIECPHCQQQTTLDWPGTFILFSQARCICCGLSFVITMSQPRC